MKIGTVEISSKLALAPMAGVTDAAFRQICGSDPTCMAEAAQIAAELSGADVVDINMGCPVGKVVKNGDGSALMKDPEKAARIAEAVVRSSPVPVTAKIRRGWDMGNLNAVEVAKLLEQAGVSAIAVHGRTRVQMYGGQADWNSIREVKEAVNVPVIANGDVFKPADAMRILERTGADMAMIGRGCFGNPWLFTQAPLSERCDTVVRQIELSAAARGERTAVLEARRHYCWYLKGIPHAGYYKEQIVRMNTLEDVYTVTKGIKRDLK